MRDMMLANRESVADLRQVAEGVKGLRTVTVNLYGVDTRHGDWILVDAGMPFSAARIRRWVDRTYGRPPDSIVLTHGHFDHVGALPGLAEEWDVPVYAHPLEMPYLTGRSPYPPPDPAVGGGAFSLLAPTYPRGPVDLRPRVFALPEDGSLRGSRDWRWIHTPGHTAGHISLFREEGRMLIAGDAFVTTKPESAIAVMTQRPGLHGPPAYYTSDWEAAKLSVQRLAGLMPNVVATGHGLPMSGPRMADTLDELAANFDDWARPAQGRYVRGPAVTDERGIVSLPPGSGYPAAPAFMLATAVAGTVWYLAARRRQA